MSTEYSVFDVSSMLSAGIVQDAVLSGKLCQDLCVLNNGLPDLSRLGFGIGWFDWKLQVCCTTCLSGR